MMNTSPFRAEPRAVGDLARGPLPMRREVAQFAHHFVEMAVVDLIGMTILGPFMTFAVALLGFHDVYAEAPLLATLVMACTMTTPMVLWMRIRGHAWSAAVEMSGAMFGPALSLSALSLIGALPAARVMDWYHPVMYLAMLAVMLRRWSHYAGVDVDHREHRQA